MVFQQLKFKVINIQNDNIFLKLVSCGAPPAPGGQWLVPLGMGPSALMDNLALHGRDGLFF